MSSSAVTDAVAFPFPAGRGTPFDPPAEECRLRSGAPVIRVVLPTGGWAWLVSRHADVRELLRHPAVSADVNRPNFPLIRPLPARDDGGLPGAFIRMDAPEHTRYRRMLTPEFMIRAVQRLEPLIGRTVDRCLDAMLAAGPPADLVTAFALPVPSAVICHLLGVPYADHGFFQTRSRTLLDRTVPTERVRDAAEELREFLTTLVARRETEPVDDLMGRLAGRVRAGELTRDEAAGMSLLLLVAGHETTANMISLGTALLLRDPGRFAALRGTPDPTPAVVEELLRYVTIVQYGLPRLVTEDIHVGGQLIRAGEGVIALLSAANRDETVFPDGDRFDADRASRSHLAFGFGPHQCVGQPLARAELRSALSTLARRVPTLALAVPADRIRWRHDSLIHGLDQLPVTW